MGGQGWVVASIRVLLLLLAPSVSSACQKNAGDWCQTGGEYDCCSGLTCHPGAYACYPNKRGLEQPCIKGECGVAGVHGQRSQLGPLCMRTWPEGTTLLWPVPSSVAPNHSPVRLCPNKAPHDVYCHWRGTEPHLFPWWPDSRNRRLHGLAIANASAVQIAACPPTLFPQLKAHSV
jgi:hypothetical protein